MALQSFTVRSPDHCRLIDVTGEVARLVQRSGVTEGICVVSAPHTTAGITINENADPSVARDILMELDRIVPLADGYSHAEGNSAAHIKASLVGSSVQLPVSGGRLILGTWQGIYFCEFDGPRNRSVNVQVLGSSIP
jgi:secondary thiamine-phosphate synthase enzyme